MTDEQIEQLARWLHHHFDTEHLSWAEESEGGRDYYRKMARALVAEVPFLAEWADRMSPPVSTEGAPDRRVDAGFEDQLQLLYEDARTTVARAIGLARDIGYRQALIEHPDEALDPEAVRAVELEDPETGQRGTLIGPADKIDALVRPEAVVVTVPLQALEALARESTLVAAAFDDVVAPRSGYEGQQAKIATLIGDLGVEGL